MNDVIDKNNGLQINKLSKINLNKKMSIDHLHIDVIISLGLIKIPLNKIKFMMIIRDPIERFVSICNYQAQDRGETMEKHISNLNIC